MQVSKRLFELETENAFAVLEKANQLKSQGKDIINLGIGQPDFPTPNNILEAAKKATSGLTYMGLPGKPGGVSIEFLGPPIQTGMTSGQGMLAGCEDLIKMKPEPWFE